MASTLPVVTTPALLASIRRHQDLPRHTWYLVAAATLTILNRPDEIPSLYQHALDHGMGGTAIACEKEQLKMSRRMREALIKAAAIGGFPKTINALLALKKVTPEHLLDEPDGLSPTSRRTELYDTPVTQVLRRGEVFFNLLYGKVSRRIMGQMDRSGTEDLGLAARMIYGYTLSNTAVLTAAETSFVMIAGLIPQDVNPQLKGHLKGALAAGASVDQVRAVRSIAIEICEASGMKRLSADSHDGWGWRSEIATI